MEPSKAEKQQYRITKHLFSELSERRLTESQAKFVSGAKKYFKRNGVLSENQLRVLMDIREYAPTI